MNHADVIIGSKKNTKNSHIYKLKILKWTGKLWKVHFFQYKEEKSVGSFPERIYLLMWGLEILLHHCQLFTTYHM
jgi:hypothetical protein